jgi:hypothetical protein
LHGFFAICGEGYGENEGKKNHSNSSTKYNNEIRI